MVLTLKMLVKAGHAFDVVDLCVWAITDGWTPPR